MKTFIYITLLFILSFSFASCLQKNKETVEDTSVIIHDTPARGSEGIENEESEQPSQLENVPQQEVRKEKANVKVVNTGDVQKLKKYSVIVAALTKEYGINALKSFFERDGIDYFVVRSPQGLHYFVIYSSDSEEEALKARSQFLLRNAVDKSREDIWHQYYIQLTDAFILEKR